MQVLPINCAAPLFSGLKVPAGQTVSQEFELSETVSGCWVQAGLGEQAQQGVELFAATGLDGANYPAPLQSCLLSGTKHEFFASQNMPGTYLQFTLKNLDSADHTVSAWILAQ